MKCIGSVRGHIADFCVKIISECMWQASVSLSCFKKSVSHFDNGAAALVADIIVHFRTSYYTYQLLFSVIAYQI